MYELPHLKMGAFVYLTCLPGSELYGELYGVHVTTWCGS